MYASARAGGPEHAHSVGQGPIEIGLDPHVVAGALPRGATGVRVQDHACSWHAAATGRGGWLCVLPQRSRGDEQPPFEYLDASGNAFTPTTLEPATLAAAFQERLIRVHGYNTAGAKQRLRAIMPEPLPGTLDGNPITLELMTFPRPMAARPGLVAVLHADAYTVTVQCGGAPPDEVDLRTH